MKTVSESRAYEVPADTIRELIEADVSGFIRATGFDELSVEDGIYTVSRDIGLATFELELELVETDEFLKYEQIDGIFDRMWTEYSLEPTGTGCRLIATTEFEIGGVLGPVLEATMIKKQRRMEFTSQFDYLSSKLAEKFEAE